MAEIYDPKKRTDNPASFNGYSIRIGGVRYPYKESGPETPPAEGIKVWPCSLEGNETTDVAFIEFSPGALCPIERFTSYIEITDHYVMGQGYFLAVDPEGKIYFTKLESTEKDGGTYISYGKDWTIMWAAAKDGEGLFIIEQSTPPWKVVYEVLQSDDKRLPDEFRRLYNQIVSQ